MVKIEDYDCGYMNLKIYERLPYRLECQLEALIIKMAEGMQGKLSDFDDIDFSDVELSTLKGFDISKKIDINDFLLTNAILQPKITDEDLDNADHELNDNFKMIGDYLFDKYMDQYSKKMEEKKKLTSSPD